MQKAVLDWQSLTQDVEDEVGSTVSDGDEESDHHETGPVCDEGIAKHACHLHQKEDEEALLPPEPEKDRSTQILDARYSVVGKMQRF